MASKYWLKLYHEMLDDAKVARLPDSIWRRFIECLLLAGEMDEGGFLPPLPDMAWRLRVDDTTMGQDLSRLALAGMVELKIDSEDNERWYVSNFAKRQSASPGAERVKQWRKRKRKEAKEKEKEEKIKEEDKDTDTDTYRTVTPVTKRYSNLPQYEIPECLAGEDFEDLWIKWFAHCDTRGKPLTQISGDYILEDLASVGKKRAMDIIRHSLVKNYKSLVEPEADGYQVAARRQRKTTAADSYREVFGE